MTAARHWHGYTWVGPNDELKDHLRRPAAPGTPETQAFLRSTLPPLRTGQYLMRQPETAHTWTTPDEVTAWLVKTYQQHPPVVGENGAQSWVPLESRIVSTRDGLVNGVDALWQYYKTGGGQAVLAAICCPHTHLPELRCPAPPRS